jgi:hypothetical protein
LKDLLVASASHCHKDLIAQEEPCEVSHQTYQSAIGSLMYLAHWSRPDIIYAVSVLANHSEAMVNGQWRGVQHVLSYINTTRERGIIYGKQKSQLSRNQIYGFADADFANDVITRRSPAGYVILLNDGAIGWNGHTSNRE